MNSKAAGDMERRSKMNGNVTKDMERREKRQRVRLTGTTRKITMIGMLSALAYVIMMFDFPVPALVPGFVKMDFSELPALIGAFAMGPVEGVLICLVKNLLHLTRTQTVGVGELSNFILGAVFVFTAGMIYKCKKCRKTAIIGSVAGALAMALVSIPSNYFLTYPIYVKFMSLDEIIADYQEIYPNVNGLLGCLVMFNAPFTFLKAMGSVLITILIYKKISPVIKGTY